jgi:UDP-N-acetylmuramoyl-tripeptide--D-alanyl-D-alanine ligase
MSWRYTLGEVAAAIGAQTNAPETAFSSVSTDTRKLETGQLFVALKGENFDANNFLAEAAEKGASAVLTSRTEAPCPALFHADPLEALQRLAAWHRQKFDIPIFGITGSVGKTTTKDFTAALLASRYNVLKTPGNRNNLIGCPLALLDLQDDTGFAVIEMGANHRHEIRDLCCIARPAESVITLVGETHIEGFGGSLESIARAKAEIMEGLPADGTFYINTDNPWCVEIGKRFTGTKVRFGLEGDVRLKGCAAQAKGDMILDIDPVGRLQLPLPVPAQATSVLIACAVGLRHGITEFEGPLREACLHAPRFRACEVGPLHVLDDTYNASPPSMRAALQALSLHKDGRRLVALGDMFELGEVAERAHRELGESAAGFGVDAVFALGGHAKLVADAARGAGVECAKHFDSHNALAMAVLEYARPGDTLLVKGSRGMRMENVIRALEALVQARPGG